MQEEEPARRGSAVADHTKAVYAPERRTEGGSVAEAMRGEVAA